MHPPISGSIPAGPRIFNPDDTFSVNVKNGKQIKAKAGETLLSALEKNEIRGALIVPFRRMQYVPGENSVRESIPAGRSSGQKIRPAVWLCAFVYGISDQ